jgi:hypothetical protein
MTDVPQPDTEAARLKGSDGAHWLSGSYTLRRFSLIPGLFPNRKG